MPSEKNHNPFRVLSTASLSPELIRRAAANGIPIDCIPFIRIERRNDAVTRPAIEQLASQKAPVIFTSANALDVVVEELGGRQPDWALFVVGSSTAKKAADYFGVEKICGQAASATGLGEQIIKRMKKEKFFFFCGQERREELPALLKQKGYALEEIIVYETVSTPQRIEEAYDAVLFFSPSAVSGYFSINPADTRMVFYSIGPTTEKEIKKYTESPVIVASRPEKRELIDLLIDRVTNGPGQTKKT